MRNVTLFFLLFSLKCFAQNDTDTLSFSYSGVQYVDSVSAGQLYSRAKLFVAENFRSAKDVMQLDDKESTTLVAKGVMVPIIKIPILGNSEYGYVHFAMKIQTKDGKYRYVISDFDHEGRVGQEHSGGSLLNHKPACGTFEMSKGYWYQIKRVTNKQVLSFIQQLEKEMKSPLNDFKKDDF
jgi:hypothetical protein